MSSREFQVVKRTKVVNQANPKKNIKKVVQNKKIQNIDSTRTRSQLEIRTAQPASTFVSGRELKTNSLADAESQNQLPVRAKNGASGRVQNKYEKKVIKYDYKSKNKDLIEDLYIKKIKGMNKNHSKNF